MSSDGSLVDVWKAEGKLRGRSADPLQVGKELEIPVEEDDISELYEALSEPLAAPTPSGPGAAAALKLDPHYLHSLRVRFESITATEQNALAERYSAAAAAMKEKPSLADITKVIQINSLMNRPEQAQMAFDQIRANGYEPDVIAYTNLIDAYARANDAKAAVEVFRSLQEANLQANEITYGAVIKSCVAAGELKAAMKLYEDMKKRGLPVPQPIFTTLIQGCLHAGQVKRAWKTFDYMRGELYAPDAVSYSLMIHACSKTQEAERALDLFREMTEKGLKANEITFTAVIQACASRKDYYEEAFALLEQMAGEGFEPDRITYSVLLQATARQGDVARARVIWNDIVGKMEHQEAVGKPLDPKYDLAPNEYTYRWMFTTYAHAIKIRRRTSSGPYLEEEIEAEYADIKADGEEEVVAGEGNETVAEIEEEPQNALLLAETERLRVLEDLSHSSLVDISESGTALRLTSDTLHPPYLLEEATCLWKFLTNDATITTTGDEPLSNLPAPRAPLSSKLLDAYLEVLCSNPHDDSAAPAAIEFFDTAYKAYNISRTGNSYGSILRLVAKNRTLMRTRGKEVWEDLLKWDEEREKAMLEEAGPDVKLKETEKEEIRAKEGRGTKAMFRNFVKVTNGFTRIGDVKSALDTIAASRVFRYQFYLPHIHFTHVWSLLNAVRASAEDGYLDDARRLVQLCPPPTRSAADAVADMLKAKWVAKGWWGWDILGIKKEVRQKAFVKRLRDERKVRRLKMAWAKRESDLLRANGEIDPNVGLKKQWREWKEGEKMKQRKAPKVPWKGKPKAPSADSSE
ncbi:hypothetical protein HK104_010892 [Borealophlyctis nickersoniae]|nr:hypothetical protein HK104_010892 [Borealophlyctis nickersoniae]